MALFSFVINPSRDARWSTAGLKTRGPGSDPWKQLAQQESLDPSVDWSA